MHWGRVKQDYILSIFQSYWNKICHDIEQFIVSVDNVSKRLDSFSLHTAPPMALLQFYKGTSGDIM